MAKVCVALRTLQHAFQREDGSSHRWETSNVMGVFSSYELARKAAEEEGFKYAGGWPDLNDHDHERPSATAPGHRDGVDFYNYEIDAKVSDGQKE